MRGKRFCSTLKEKRRYQAGEAKEATDGGGEEEGERVEMADGGVCSCRRSSFLFFLFLARSLCRARYAPDLVCNFSTRGLTTCAQFDVRLTKRTRDTTILEENTRDFSSPSKLATRHTCSNRFNTKL